MAAKWLISYFLTVFPFDETATSMSYVTSVGGFENFWCPHVDCIVRFATSHSLNVVSRHPADLTCFLTNIPYFVENPRGSRWPELFAISTGVCHYFFSPRVHLTRLF